MHASLKFSLKFKQPNLQADVSEIHEPGRQRPHAQLPRIRGSSRCPGGPHDQGHEHRQMSMHSSSRSIFRCTVFTLA